MIVELQRGAERAADSTDWQHHLILTLLYSQEQVNNIQIIVATISESTLEKTFTLSVDE